MNHKPLSREFLLQRGWCCNFGCLNCPYKQMRIIKNKTDLVQLGITQTPERYPAIVWQEFEECSLTGFRFVTNFHYPPKDVDLKSYLRGFQAASSL